ncbi:MAG TPA: restriction endonuclease subunit S [Nitrospira sp.]|nr:restriction endonuclease subunit S [Nitrospira sp.]
MEAEWKKMKRWPTKPLGELVSLEYGEALKSEERSGNGRYPVYGSNGIVGSHDAAIVMEPTIVVGRKGAIGEVHFAERGCWPIDTAFYTQFRQPGVVTLPYLLLWFRSVDLKTLAITATIPGLNRNTLYAQQVPVPPLAEQERIVKLLDEADELRKLRAEADRRTADLIPSLFHEMFGDPSINPYDWPVESVGTLFDAKRGGAKCGPFGSVLKKHEYVESGIPVWGIPNVLPNQFVEAGSLFISPSKFEELRAYAVESGDLLFSRAGTVGRICVARPSATDSIIGTNLIRVALDRERVVPEFFATLVTLLGLEAARFRANADESAYSFMNTTVLKALRMYLPPFPLQKDFAARVAEIRAMETQQATSRRRLDDLFHSLLHRAFRGEL